MLTISSPVLLISIFALEAPQLVLAHDYLIGEQQQQQGITSADPQSQPRTYMAAWQLCLKIRISPPPRPRNIPN